MSYKHDIDSIGMKNLALKYNVGKRRVSEDCIRIYLRAYLKRTSNTYKIDTLLLILESYDEYRFLNELCVNKRYLVKEIEFKRPQFRLEGRGPH